MRIESDKYNINNGDKLSLGDDEVSEKQKKLKEMEQWNRECREEFKRIDPLKFP